jgi:2-C-methyl-D-erythritol 4-phosphate cytidylyltransferase
MADTHGPAYGIVVAAGRSERMGTTDKLFAPLMGRPMLAWTLAAFKQCPAVDGVVVVALEARLADARGLVDEWRFTNVRAVVPGGARRRDSVRSGVEAAADAAIVAVHDGARPLVTPALIEQGIALARAHGAAACAVRARDTVKESAGDPPIVERTIDRSRTWLAQTPQVFARELLLQAHDAANDDATDDAALVEALGREVRLYEGDPANLKVTAPDDLFIAEALLRARLEIGL